MVQWTLNDLDLSQAVDVLPRLDPQTSLRFNLPVANWLGPDGNPKYSHFEKGDDASGIINAIIWDKGRAPGTKSPDDKGKPACWKFQFRNFKDQAMQRAKIDGTDVIRFMAPTPEQSQKIVDMVHEYAGDPDLLTPDQLSEILNRTHDELDLNDRFDGGKTPIKDYLGSSHEFLGAFLPNPKPASAIYLPGAGQFMDGPTATPQTFENGAFISFMDTPGVAKMTAADVKKLIAEKKLTVKLIQADVFSQSRAHMDGSAIDTETFAPTPVAKPSPLPRIMP